MQLTEEELDRIDVLQGCSQQCRQQFAARTGLLRLPKNHCLYSDQMHMDYLYFLLEGRVNLVKYSEHGECRVILIPEIGMMINQPRSWKQLSAAECRTLTETVLARISLVDFEQLMQQEYRLAANCMAAMEKRIRQLYRQLKNTVSLSVEKRLASKLYRLGRQFGKWDNQMGMTLIELPLSITYMAKLVGCQRETLSRCVKAMETNGVLRIERRRTHVDLAKLRRLYKGNEALLD
ncbi:MAG: Crp/Fnr family transcriptional regulator [Eubacteriales bacterium]|nr:Crp/Fnr family transcriptional regulator [Eubacteriales bacterium]